MEYKLKKMTQIKLGADTRERRKKRKDKEHQKKTRQAKEIKHASSSKQEKKEEMSKHHGQESKCYISATSSIQRKKRKG